MVKAALHDLLYEVLQNCYFEPPADMEIHYPCIIYDYTNDVDIFADNICYKSSKRYTITIIDEDPDSKIPIRLKEMLPYCRSDRNFAFDGLSHFVYTLFYDGPRIKEENNNGTH